MKIKIDLKMIFEVLLLGITISYMTLCLILVAINESYNIKPELLVVTHNMLIIGGVSIALYLLYKFRKVRFIFVWGENKNERN